MIAFDAAEIDHWADQPDATHQLPELIRRLVLATCPTLSRIDMPSGSSVWRPGWDGLLDVQDGNAWVPQGSSAWEMGCVPRPIEKANSDYEKRTANPGAVETDKTEFVFITPRRWPAKETWASARRQEGAWADIRTLDANDLVAWLQQAPAVAHWFARLVDKLPDMGWASLDEWWEHWSQMTNPAITPELVLAGRNEAGRRTNSMGSGNPQSLLRARKHARRIDRIPSRMRSHYRGIMGTITADKGHRRADPRGLARPRTPPHDARSNPQFPGCSDFAPTLLSAMATTF